MNGVTVAGLTPGQETGNNSWLLISQEVCLCVRTLDKQQQRVRNYCHKVTSKRSVSADGKRSAVRLKRQMVSIKSKG